MIMQASPKVRVIQNRGSSGLPGLVHVILENFGPVLVVKLPGDQSADVHCGRMNRRGYFLSGHEEKVFPRLAFEFDRGGIDELVVLAENEKVVSAVVIPLGNRIGFGIGMTAQRGVHVGVSFVPLVGPKKAWEKEKKVDQSDGHGSKLHELPKPVNDGHGDLRIA